MQKNYLKLVNTTSAIFVTSTLLVLLRCAVLAFGFDFDTSFFKSNTVAYIIYALFIIAVIIPFIICRKTEEVSYSPVKKGFFKDILTAILTTIFFALLILYAVRQFSEDLDSYTLLKTISHYICFVFALLSTVYYAMRLMCEKAKGTLFVLLSTAPSIFLGALLIERFASVAASAASLSHFPDIMSLLILAFFTLSEGKCLIPNFKVKSSRSLAMLLSVSVALSFSAIPDFLSVIAMSNSLSVEGVMFLIMKLVFLTYSISETLHFLKDFKESKK